MGKSKDVEKLLDTLHLIYVIIVYYIIYLGSINLIEILTKPYTIGFWGALILSFVSIPITGYVLLAIEYLVTLLKKAYYLVKK